MSPRDAAKGSTEPDPASRSQPGPPSRWGDRALAAWIVLVLVVWLLQFHATDFALYRALEREAPGLARVRGGVRALFTRSYVF